MDPIAVRLRELLHLQPFRPFTIVLVDGFKVKIPHEDFLAVTKSGVVIYDDGERMKTINPLVVSRIDEDGVGAVS